MKKMGFLAFFRIGDRERGVSGFSRDDLLGQTSGVHQIL